MRLCENDHPRYDKIMVMVYIVKRGRVGDAVLSGQL